jgi:hypothetical protein
MNAAEVEKERRLALPLADALSAHVGAYAASDYDLHWVTNQMLAEFFQTSKGRFKQRTLRYAAFNVSVRGFVASVLHAFQKKTPPSQEEVEALGGIGAVLQAIVVVSLTILAGRPISRVWVNFKEKNQGTHGSHQDTTVSHRDTTSRLEFIQCTNFYHQLLCTSSRGGSTSSGSARNLIYRRPWLQGRAPLGSSLS